MPKICYLRYRDAEQTKADNNVFDHGKGEVSENAEAIWGKNPEEIKSKMESVNQMPFDLDQAKISYRKDTDFVVSPKLKESYEKGNAATNGDEIVYDKPSRKRSYKDVHQCTECHWNFRKLSQLRRHHRYIHAERMLKCDICDKSFGRQKYLNIHKKIHLQNREEYPCEMCDKKFQTKRGLIKHQNLHDQSKKIECQICQKKFNGIENFTRHILRMHGGIKQNCSFCDRKFSSRYEIIAHMRREHFNLLRQQDRGTGDLHPIFQGRRTYECYRCKYSQNSITSIKNHMETCEGVRIHIHKPVKCELCNTRHTTIRNLKIHKRRSHSIYERKLKNRGTKCEYCPENVSQQSDKDYHQHSVHVHLTFFNQN